VGVEGSIVDTSERVSGMNRDEALKLLRGGEEEVNEWNRRRRAGEFHKKADLREADLSGANLTGADLNGVDLSGANLRRANIREADLSGAELDEADFTEADLTGANLKGAQLSGAKLARDYLSWADLRWAKLHGANLGWADLSGTDLRRADLSEANLIKAHCNGTNFADVDLSTTKGLDSVTHSGPSTIGTDTLFRSQGQIPDVFLRGCGLPDALVEYLASLIGAMSPIQFYSCFVSYSTRDEEFAKRLHARMVEEKLRVWYAPEDIQAGKKLHEQIDDAIRVHDKLLLLVSENSMRSKWVRDEIRRARKAEVQEAKRKLFPVRLVSFQAVEQWKSFYADLGEDLAEEIREYFIPDFSNWKDHDAFEAAFARLLNDLKAEESTGMKPA
jgi:hypothetical protein